MMKPFLAALTLSLLLVACATVPNPPSTAPGADFLTRNAAAKRAAIFHRQVGSEDGTLADWQRYGDV